LPPGIALAGSIVEEVASGEEEAITHVAESVRGLPVPLAVRSSAVDEDGADASFAGQHITLLNIRTVEEVGDAVRDIWWSANSDSAITYRQRVGLFHRPSVGVVVQSLLDPAVAGVMFTQNPINGADERMIEASWGLGEAVVAGQVIPDSYRIAPTGEILERRAGLKKVAIRPLPAGGTFEEPVPAELVEKLCLTDDQLGELYALATRCEQVYGKGRDIEWAIADDELYILQCRAITRAGEITSAPGQRAGAPAEVVQQVPLFAGLGQQDLEKVARLFKKRRFAKGETVIKEGAGGAAFFLIESGEAGVTVKGKPRPPLSAGAHFGEVALIDGKPRMATITANSDLVCYGLTYWDFQPLVQKNGAIAWALLQSVANMLRAAQED
jgi:pyruvate,water dikinase